MTESIKLFTIGFTKKSAERFFTKLKNAGVSRVLDVRLNNSSQLAGFAKKDDLEFFLKSIADIEYIHLPDLAPTQDILTAYKREKGDWAVYEPKFLDLMKRRQIEESTRKELFDGACLLCSEDKPHHCHRRLVAEYLAEKWGNVEVVHIV
ncbi:DUF488 domain-containing protein [Zavarzinella formosa]|uniref:DUF488 domain-containing protein n=1 Tax=Zavarzinella formosa TaxID=360055 RepID=UPI00038209DF|nr:DUF488 domain-containing protein [Zavarzinella formosa]